MQLRTARLALREYATNDFDAVHAFSSDVRIAEFVDWGPNTAADTRSFLETCLAAQRKQVRTNFTLAVVVPGGVPLGSVGLTVAGSVGQLGYVIAPSHWGRGYATEAASALLAFGMDELKLQRINATCRPENKASARVLEKIGMARAGLRKADRLIRGEWCDSLHYSFPAVRGNPGT